MGIDCEERSFVIYMAGMRCGGIWWREMRDEGGVVL